MFTSQNKIYIYIFNIQNKTILTSFYDSNSIQFSSIQFSQTTLSFSNLSRKMENVYSAAVRGFHYYRKFWKPIENERLTCFHEDGNPYDRFAIKTATSNGATVGHLPKEISRVTNSGALRHSTGVFEVIFPM